MNKEFNIVYEICSIIVFVIEWLIKSKKHLICTCGENEVHFS